MHHPAEYTDLSAQGLNASEVEQALKSLDALRASLQTVVTSPTDDHIPVLHDIVKPGPAITPQPDPTATVDEQALAMLLDSLRNELDALIEDMLSDARNRFEHLLARSSEELKTAVRGRLETQIIEHFSAR